MFLWVGSEPFHPTLRAAKLEKSHEPDLNKYQGLNLIRTLAVEVRLPLPDMESARGLRCGEKACSAYVSWWNVAVGLWPFLLSTCTLYWQN